jgi:putative phage-type endonuclease
MNAQLAPMDNGLSPLRVGRITGSRIAAVLGLNPYSKRADVLREMVREAHGAPREFTGNAATEYGQRMEPIALAQYETERGVMTYGGGECVVDAVHDFLAVTPDGLIGDDGMIECKAPFRGNYTTPEGCPYYLPQMQLQMAVTGRAWCDFAVLQRDGVLHVTRVHADRWWLSSIMGDLAWFMGEYTAAFAEPSQFLADLERSDTAWRRAANAYLAAKFTRENAEVVEKDARDALLALAPDGGKGCGVNVIKSERAGSVAYAKAVKDLLPDADLSKYTSKPTTVFTVRTEA